MQPNKQPGKLIIMRGVPGSGKSYKAKKLAEAGSGVVYSTDDFFQVNGKYVFDGSKIGEYHKQNQLRTAQAMKQNLPLIVVDNTNIKLWEMRKYVEMAQRYGYEVDIQTSDTDWACDAKQCAKKNSHGVPEDKIQQMLDNFEKFNTIEDILKAEMVYRKRN